MVGKAHPAPHPRSELDVGIILTAPHVSKAWLFLAPNRRFGLQESTPDIAAESNGYEGFGTGRDLH